ncbi:MAG: DUF4382 domain-containing protein [Terracidiphilus sp.]
MLRSTQPSQSSRRLQNLLVLAFLLVLTGITGVIVACSSGNNVITNSGMSQVKVSISDPATCAAPDGPYSAVWVTITDVQANTSASAGDSDGGWVDLTPNLSKNNDAVQVNLLGEANNQCFLASLGDNSELQAGSYQQIRIILAQTTAGLTLSSGTSTSMNSTDVCQGSGGANCVVMGSGNSAQTYPLLLSSEAKTGLKIPSGQIAGGAFTISAGQTEDLNIDFNTCSSIVREGNGQFRLKPVLHAGEVGTTSVSLNGKVTGAAGTPIAGAMVALEQPDPSGAKDASGNPIERILMSTSTASDGTWSICPVMVGDTTKPYDLVVTGADSNGVLYAPSIETGVSIGTTAGTVVLNASTLDNSVALSTATVTGQVTSVNSSMAATVIDAQLSVLETVNSVDYTIPMPMTTTQSGGASLTVTTAPNTTQSPACNPTSTDCANYSIQVPALGAYFGAWSSTGATLTQPAVLPMYSIDGMATVSGSTSTADCTPSEVITSAGTLAGSPLTGTANLAFTGCQ